MSKTVTIPLRGDPSEKPTTLTKQLGEYISSLEKNGYSRILLTGLRQLGAQSLEGQPVDEFLFWVDPDAQFLLDYQQHLEQLVAEGAKELHRTYLEDGIFEFSAFVAPGSTIVRVGLFQRSFISDANEATTIPTERYLAMWRGITKALVEASGRSGVENT